MKLTLDPAGIGPGDIDALRAHGFDDGAITVAAQVVSYFNYINRIADGLGVAAEPWMSVGEGEWRASRTPSGKRPR